MHFLMALVPGCLRPLYYAGRPSLSTESLARAKTSSNADSVCPALFKGLFSIALFHPAKSMRLNIPKSLGSIP